VDNVSDALDRRVELAPLACGELAGAAENRSGRRSPL
jgi:hypothetical protein